MEDSAIKSITELISPNLKNSGKTLVYFASGSLIKDQPFSDLNYENIFFIDNEYMESSFNGQNIFRLKLDCIEAVHIFKKLGITIDCFVALNEGLFEGGGNYPLNSDSFLGYCYPILSDKLIHIGCKDYYDGYKMHHLRKHYLDIPFKKKKIITSEHLNYILPSLFSNLVNPIVTLLEGKKSSKHSFNAGRLKISVKHSSIWSDTEVLDALFIKYDNNYQKEKLESLENKVFAIKDYEHRMSPYTDDKAIKYDGGYDIDGILDLIKANKFERIGFVPNLWNYDELFSNLEHSASLSEVIFYHLNKGDFSELYAYGKV